MGYEPGGPSIPGVFLNPSFEQAELRVTGRARKGDLVNLILASPRAVAWIEKEALGQEAIGEVTEVQDIEEDLYVVQSESDVEKDDEGEGYN